MPKDEAKNLKVGLTGGIASGKSSVSKLFAAKGITIIDADLVARQSVAPNSEALQRIVENFGTTILQDDQSLDRSKLRELVFSDQQNKKALESILHPIIRRELTKQITESNSEAYTLADIPLLVESNYQSDFDEIVVVDCKEEQQIERIKKRDNSDINVIRMMIKSQASRTERLRHATHIIDNSGPFELLSNQVDQLHGHFLKLASKRFQ